MANAAYPRIDSDADHRAAPGAGFTGSDAYTTGDNYTAGTSGVTGTSTTAGPHKSDTLNKMVSLAGPGARPNTLSQEERRG